MMSLCNIVSINFVGLLQVSVFLERICCLLVCDWLKAESTSSPRKCLDDVFFGLVFVCLSCSVCFYRSSAPKPLTITGLRVLFDQKVKHTHVHTMQAFVNHADNMTIVAMATEKVGVVHVSGQGLMSCGFLECTILDQKPKKFWTHVFHRFGHL